MAAPIVFISYSHQDEMWKTKLLPHLRALEQAGVKMKVWHDRKIDGGDKWYPEIQDAMSNAAVAVLLVSADFLASGFCVKEEVPFLLDRQEKQGMLLIPVLIRKCPWKAHRWLADRQMLPRDGKCVALDFPGEQADAVFTEVAEQVLDYFRIASAKEESARRNIAERLLKRVRPPRVHVQYEILETRLSLSPNRIDLTRLPETGSALFGRDEELKRLDATWSDNSPSRTRVLAFTAHGGVGKSTLINHWLGEMKRDNYRGATRVFGWSFYSQGMHKQGPASADTFVAAALRFFGDEAMAASPAAGWDKGVRLAHLVGAERALLVLDGMEPLQSAQSFERGKLRDPALESLLRGLAKQSAGLCLITTRESLPDLARKPGFAERDLEQITPQAGRALLRTARVVGTDAELESLAQRFGPHALAISLLGVYLHEQPGHGIGPAQKLEQISGRRPVDRVLAGFEQRLGDSAEREILHLLGLFDRPADAGCLKALRVQPAIPGLTDRVTGLGDAEWDRVLTRLEKLRLIHTRQSDSGQRFVDAHPLIREHFAEQLREKNPDAWRAAHRRLYEHLCATTPDKPQPTLEDLQPLYQAVAHGCLAGLHQEAHDEVHLRRIRHGWLVNYSVTQLGAFGTDLSALACFFEQPWSIPCRNITERDQVILLGNSATYLSSLGRLTEALEPMRVAVQRMAALEEWEQTSIAASNLSDLELTLGQVAGAVRDAQQSVTYADRSGDAFQRLARRAAYANALHQEGRWAKAEMHFRDAEQMQAELQPDHPLLYSVQGVRYCDLLLSATERAAWQLTLTSDFELRTSDLVQCCDAVSQRAEQTLDWWTNHFANASLLTLALEHLTQARAALYSAILTRSEVRSAKSEVGRAVDGLRRAGTQEFIVRGLLTRAWLRFLTGARTGPESAQEDLDEAWEIAERGSMKLLLTDIHLYRARLFGMRNAERGARNEETKYPWESPEADLKAAEKLINECGYHRRDEELADARKAILGS